MNSAGLGGEAWLRCLPGWIRRETFVLMEATLSSLQMHPSCA